MPEIANLDVSNIAVTPVRPSVLRQYLENYDNQTVAKLLFDGFNKGFKLQYEGPRSPTVCKNLKSIELHQEDALALVMKEVHLGRIAGPFPYKPFSNLRISPVGLIPKKDGSWRLIHHLSYPEGGSINDFIDHKYCTVNYTSFDTALEMLEKLGTGALIARLDIKSAFRLLPIHPSDFELLGYKIGENYFVDKCLPFGCSISCSLFEKFSTFLEWELRRRSSSQNVVHYLDDFLVAGRANTSDCVALMDCYISLCSEIGVPLANEKTIGPTTVLTFLGLQIDTNKMIVQIPDEKLNKLRIALIETLQKTKVTLKELQSLTGLLSFCSKAIPSARAFNRRFYDAMIRLRKHYHRIRVNLEMKSDIRVWLQFLDSFNGCSYYNMGEWQTDDSITLFTDSAGGSDLGCGAIYQTHWAFMSWPREWVKKPFMKNVTFLELVPIVLAFHIWASKLKDKKIILNTDNQGLVPILNKKTCKSKKVMYLVRSLVLLTMTYNIQFKAVHFPGKLNQIADSISRQQWSRFRRLCPQADSNPVPIPESFHLLLSSPELMKS